MATLFPEAPSSELFGASQTAETNQAVMYIVLRLRVSTVQVIFESENRKSIVDSGSLGIAKLADIFFEILHFSSNHNK